MNTSQTKYSTKFMKPAQLIDVTYQFYFLSTLETILDTN